MKILKLTAAIALTALAFVLFHGTNTTEAALQSWFGEVTHISDGDTFDVDWDPGHAPSSGYTRIRVAGMDTNEVDGPDGNECLADAATARLEQLIPIGTRVKLVAENKSSYSQERALRHVFYGAGYSTNLSAKMIQEGYGLPANFANEPSYKNTYFEAGEQAMIDEAGLWSPGVCGGSPGSWPSVETYVNYDAEGDDAQNLNGEYIEIKNNGPTAFNMSNWTLRGSARLNDQTHTLPGGLTIQPGSIHTIHSGNGSNTSTKTYLGRSTAWLNNAGDVIYIRDLDLNMRITKFWPCTVSCEPEKSLIVEDVQYDAPGDDRKNPNGEWIRLRNVGSSTIELNNWRLKESGKFYRFDSNDKIYAGQRFIIKVGSGSDSSSVKYWGNSSGILNNSGTDYVRILNNDSVELDCYTWGPTDECGTESMRGAIRMSGNYNASGNDVNNPNGEWITFQNTSSKTMNMSGYKVYTPGYTYTFKSGVKINGNKYLRLRIGSGSDTTYNKYWGNSGGILRNSGDYVQLRSGSNEVIFQHKWPCPISCGYTHGLVIDKVNYNAPGDDRKNPNGEWIRIKNKSATRKDLQNWKIKVGPYQLVSVGSRPMDPGESIKIYIGKGTNTSTKMYWGKSKGILYNTGSTTVDLYSPLRHLTKCSSWGSGSC